ncbi:MAG: glycogen debranching enzyme N-terminal domain-containing protein, partial [Vallitaleaceae bacterium]|nr:glycogen debranching enzyme N-terminal domain-containing protein [Vallitaleaceae bacterium]
CNTRKHHGLLVVPLPEISEDNYMLLSSLDETVIQHGAEFNMGVHKFAGEHYSPKGHKYIREFNIETVAKTIYRVGGVVFSKERVFISHENRILLKYTLLEARSPVTMRFKPLLGFRNVNQLSRENDDANKEYQEINNGISSCLYPNFPNLYMQFSKENEFVSTPDWYRGIEYYKEQERGYDYKEDLFVPGYFEMPMKKGESIFFSAGVVEADPKKFKKLYREELAKRTSRLDFHNCLKNAGQQFYNKIGEGHYLMAGYPWFKCRARDQFVALPGVSLSIDDIPFFENIMGTAVEAIEKFISHQPHESHIYELDAPDVLLWFVWSIQQYAEKTSIKATIKKYGDVVFKVLSFIREQQHPNLSLSDNGLLETNGYDKPASWMNGVVYGKPVIQRTGFLVEINALWYNALKFGSELARGMQNEYEADVLNYQAEFARQSYLRMFWNGKYLYDYVVNNYRDCEVRPNMLFAVSLPYSTLDKSQQKLVVDIVTRELLTPKGLRSLSPQSGNYKPEYRGDEIGRSYSYHNGTVWPWLMGAFSEAYLKVYSRSGLSFIERRLIGFESEMSELCIGTLNELFDGNPPFKGHGAMSFAMNVSEILRLLSIVKKFEAEQKKNNKPDTSLELNFE